MYIGRYNYEELRKAAESGNQEDLNNLGKWFEEYGRDYWNGEYYDADGLKVKPIFEDHSTEEVEDFRLVGFELV